MIEWSILMSWCMAVSFVFHALALALFWNHRRAISRLDERTQQNGLDHG